MCVGPLEVNLQRIITWICSFLQLLRLSHANKIRLKIHFVLPCTQGENQIENVWMLVLDSHYNETQGVILLLWGRGWKKKKNVVGSYGNGARSSDLCLFREMFFRTKISGSYAIMGPSPLLLGSAIGQMITFGLENINLVSEFASFIY